MGKKKNNISPHQNQLPRKRFIPMLVLILIGLVTLIFFREYIKPSMRNVLHVVDNGLRKDLIYLIGAIIGVVHYYYQSKNEEGKYEAVRFFSGLFTSIATAVGYAVLINSAMNIASGTMKEYFFEIPYFVKIESIDYLTIALVSLFIVFIGGYLLYKMVLEILFDFVQSPSHMTKAEKREE